MDKLVKVLQGQHCGQIVLKDPGGTRGLRGSKLAELGRGTGSVWWEHPRSRSLSSTSLAQP